MAAASQRRLSRSSLRLAALWTCTSWLVARADWRRPEKVSSTFSNPFPPQVCRVHRQPEWLLHRGHDPRLAEDRRDRTRGALFAPRLLGCVVPCFDRRALVSESLAFRFRAVGAYSLSHGRMHRSRSFSVPPSCPARVRSVDVRVCCLRAERAVYVPWVSYVDYLQHVSI